MKAGLVCLLLLAVLSASNGFVDQRLHTNFLRRPDIIIATKTEPTNHLLPFDFPRGCRQGPRLFLADESESNDDSSSSSSSKKWKFMGQIASLESPWLTIKGERLLDDKDQLLDYWRVEKDDSAVVLTLHKGNFVFHKPVYRVGLDQVTLDFPGGRIPNGKSPQSVVMPILERELGVAETDVLRVEPLNRNGEGWPVNSSFSNQKLFGFVAELKEDCKLDPSLLHSKSYSATEPNSLRELLDKELTCLQCRAVLQEWKIQQLFTNS